MCDDMIRQFWSTKDKVFYDTPESNDLIIRPKGFFDPMIPNAAAIAAQNIYMLFRRSLFVLFLLSLFAFQLLF